VATASGLHAQQFAPSENRLRVPIMDLYVVKELTGPFLFSLGAVLLFWFVNIFFLAADYIINAHASVFLVLRFLLFRIPQSTPWAFPFASLFATLLAFSRLAADNELVAMRTSGIPFLRICMTPLALGLAMFGLSYYINDTVTPKAVELSTRTFYQIIYHTSELPVLPEFFRKDDTTGRVFYVGDIAADHKTLMHVMIFEPAVVTPFRQVTNAETADIEGQGLHLHNARVTRFKPTGEFNGGTVVKDLIVGLPIGENVDQFLNTANADAYTMNSKQLAAQIKAMQSTGTGGQSLDSLKITLAQKLALPFSSFVAVLIGLPLATVFGKKGRTLGIALSILLFFAYYLLMSAFGALGKNAAMDPYLAAWIPNIVMAIGGVFLFRRVES
jgi:lipopolysaccharide export system permease protein